MMLKIKHLLFDVGLWLLEKFDHCDICNGEDVEAECPCGLRVCAECQEPLYSDETCCKNCAVELRASWAKCPGHEWDDHYESEDGGMVKECIHCGMPAPATEEPVAR